MEPSSDQYIFMDKRQYSESINDHLEPRGARDLLFKQFLEREVCLERQANRNLKLSNHWPADPKFNALQLIQTEGGLRGVYSYV